MKYSSKLFFVVFLLSTSCIESIWSERNDHVIELRVTLEESEQSIPSLRIRLINKGEEPFPIYAGLLPWENYNALQLVSIPVVRLGDNISYDAITKQPFATDDPVLIQNFIPQSTLEGRIMLSERFPNITDLLTHKHVLICWSYALSKYGETNFHWYHGYVLIHKLRSEKIVVSSQLDDIFKEKCSTTLVHIAR